MDLRGLANSVSNTVNANVIVTVQASTGYTVATSGLRQTPSYAAGVTGPAQLQALDGSELKKIDGLNIQGVVRAIYLRGPLAGVVRPNSKGGDLVTIASPAPAELIGTWLVVKVLESWPLWTKCAIWLQVPAS
jgi:hypothetical protein